jgi:hypothetical protein
MRRTAFVLLGALALAGVLGSIPILSGLVGGEAGPKQATATSRDALASRLARREIQRAPSSIPGREIVQALVAVAYREEGNAWTAGRPSSICSVLGKSVGTDGRCAVTWPSTSYVMRPLPGALRKTR